MSNSTQNNLEAIVKAVEQHDGNCKEKAKAVALAPYEHERLGFDSVTVKGRSVPLKPDDSLGTGRFRVICDGYHGPKKEIEQEETVEAPAPAERELVPVGAPMGPDPETEIEGIFGITNISEGWKLWSQPSNDPEADFWAYVKLLHQQGWHDRG